MGRPVPGVFNSSACIVGDGVVNEASTVHIRTDVLAERSFSFLYKRLS